MRAFRFRGALHILGLALALTVALPLSQQAAYSQAITQTGGSIQGTITDPGGAVIPSAKIVVTSPETGYTRTFTSTAEGLYSVGPLNPGRYTVTVEAPGFAKQVLNTVVATGTVTSGNIRLTVSSTGETVEVSAGDVQVNTEQVGVAGIVTSQQIDTLPINGRNILDIAQIQPGVILQSGAAFDPTKTGYSAIGVNGQNGRTTRILIDGQDVSDETVGTVVFNIPEGAIGEFQLNRSTQDVSGSVTSTGQVLMVSKTGTNRFHGNAFGIFQDARAGFTGINGNAGDDAPFQRDQYGAYVGGPVLRDKLFFFGGAERIKQVNSSPVSYANTFFTTIYDTYPQVPDPFKDTTSIGRLDWNGPWGVHYFVRAAYSNNAGYGISSQTPYGIFQNQDNVPSIVGGADITAGRFTHSLRFGYLKFINNLNSGTASLGSAIYNPATQLGVPFELYGSSINSGDNYLAPQKTYQSSKSFRYDGTWTKGAHSIKFGGESSRILEGGFAAFYSTMLSRISTGTTNRRLATCGTSNPIGGIDANGQCLGDPLYGWKSYGFILGNGNGSFSEKKGFGLPGGAFDSWRLAAYIGDTWKIKPYLTLVAGLRWSTDTGRANQDLDTVRCGQVDEELQFSGCDSTTPDTPLFDFYGPGLGLGKKTHQPYANFGPQLGLAFSPGDHRYVLRGGIGIYYESNLFNNASNARAQNSPAEFPGWAYGSVGYTSTSINLPGWQTGIRGFSNAGDPCTVGTDGCNSLADIFSWSIADATLLMAKVDTKYKAAAQGGNLPNSSFVGFANGDALGIFGSYGGPYKTPYSIQINGGVQYQIKPGLVVNVDYVHNATLKVPITVDTNHTAAARTLNATAAKNAITATLGDCDADSIDGAIANGCTIDDFTYEGLTTLDEYLGGVAASAYGLDAAHGAAFAGTNSNVGEGSFILPVGKSAYDALQIVLQQQKQHPLPGIVNSNVQLSYNLSQVIANSKGGENQFFSGSGAWNNDSVNKYIGRNGQDHTNMLSIATSVTAKYGPRISLIAHFFSAAPSTLQLLNLGKTPLGNPLTAAGAIFKSDLDGDGTTADLLPGTLPGSYMHEVKGKKLGELIDNWNSQGAGQLTPAGKALVDAGLFTTNQLVQLGATTQKILPVQASTPIKNPATRTLDARFSYPINFLKRFREGLVITPEVSFYNVANMANYTQNGAFSGLLDTTVVPGTPAGDSTIAAANYLNGANDEVHLWKNRVLRGVGNGTYNQGAPRQAEFSLKIEF